MKPQSLSTFPPKPSNGSKKSRTRSKPAITFKEWSDELAHVSEEEQTEWIKRSLKSKHKLHIFGQYFFPHIIKGNGEVPACHLELLYELGYPDDGAIIFPRGHAKSTWVKIDLLHDIVYKRENVIVYISDTSTAACFQMDAVKGELESNDLLMQVYGFFVPPVGLVGRKWSSGHFEATNGVNIVARGRLRGRGVNIRNNRPSKIVIDDVEDDEEVRNPEQRAKVNHWLYNVIFPSKDKKRGKIKMIGTVLHEMAEIIAFHRQHGGLFKQAIMEGQPIWPEMFSLEDLNIIRNKIGTRAFNREYMQNPMPEGEAGIKSEWLTKADYNLLDPQYGYEAVIFIDPQSGESAKADEYAITTLYRAKGTVHRYIVEQDAGKVSQFDQARRVVRTWLKHRSVTRTVGIETLKTQTAIWQTITDWKARKINFNTDELPEHERIDESDRNIPIIKCAPTQDKLARLQVFEPDFERAEIHLRPEMLELKTQLMYMGTTNIDHDDRADSLVGALELMGRNSPPRTSLPDKQKTGYNTTIVGNIMKKKW